MGRPASRQTFRKLQDRERQVRKDLIIDAAQRVFGEKTFDKVSMQEIAAVAGIAKSSIYTYFPNQEALFVEAAYRDTCTFVDRLEQELADVDPAEAVDVLVRRFLEYYSENETHWRMITHFALYGTIGTEAMARLNKLARRFMDLLQQVIETAGGCEESRLAAHTLFACLSGILIAFRKYPGRTEAQRLEHMRRIGRMVAAMVKGLLVGPPQGGKRGGR